MGFNPGKGHKGPYRGKSGKNYHRNPQPGQGHGGYHAKKGGCGGKKRIVPAVALFLLLSFTGVWGIVELFV